MKKALSIPDMSCQHCAGRIQKALDGAGVEGYEIALEAKEVRVEGADAEKAADVLAAAGYPPVLR